MIKVNTFVIASYSGCRRLIPILCTCSMYVRELCTHMSLRDSLFPCAIELSGECVKTCVEYIYNTFSMLHLSKMLSVLKCCTSFVARERLLCESKLPLEKTDEICRTAESMLAQLKVVEDSSSATVSAIKSSSDQPQTSPKEGNTTRECWNCGCRHEFHKRELCPSHMARHVTNAINQTILQPSVVASPLQGRSNWLMTMKSTKLSHIWDQHR